VLSDLGPDELSWIEFRSGDRKVVHMQPFVSSQKILNRLALVNGVAVPDQDNRTGDSIKNLSKKGNHLFARETMPIRTNAQTNSFALWRYQQDAQQVEALVMVDGGAQDRCLAATRPATLEWRNKRKAAFIFKSEGSAQLLALFLSWAVPPSSTARWLPHPGAALGAGVAGYSSPSAASHARPHSDDSERQTTARSPERSDPASSSCQHTQRHRLLCPTLSPSVSPDSRTISLGVLVGEWTFSSWAFSLPASSDPRSGVSLQEFLPILSASFLAPTAPNRAPFFLLIVRLCLSVSYAHYDTF